MWPFYETRRTDSRVTLTTAVLGDGVDGLGSPAGVLPNLVVDISVVSGLAAAGGHLLYTLL